MEAAVDELVASVEVDEADAGTVRVEAAAKDSSSGPPTAGDSVVIDCCCHTPPLH